MSDQDTSFEALAASPGDYAIDSEWMGDSPPALTVDFIQDPHNHVHHIHQFDRIQDPKAQRNFQQFGGTAAAAAAAAGGNAGIGKFGPGRDPLLSGDPTLALSQATTVSSPESLLSSFQDSSSSDIPSSKRTSTSALSSLVSGTPAKKGRGRPKGSKRSVATTGSNHPTGSSVPKRVVLAHVKAPAEEDDVIMTSGALDDGDGDCDGDGNGHDNNDGNGGGDSDADDTQQTWSFRDYLHLDDDQDENDDANGGQLNRQGPVSESDILQTIDPKSIQRTASSTRLGDEQLPQEVAAAAAAAKAEIEPEAGPGPSAYQGNPSPFEFVSASNSPAPDEAFLSSLSTPQAYYTPTNATAKVDALNGSAQQPRKGHNKAASQYSLSQSMNNLKTSSSREVSPTSNFVFSQGPSPINYLQNSQSPIESGDFRFGFFPNNAAEPLPTVSNFMFSESGPASPTSSWQGHLTPQQQQQLLNNTMPQMPMFRQGPTGAVAGHMNAVRRPLRLFVGVTPNKSRVETQIPVTIFLSALPPGVTRLHLPPHTISKPKLLAKSAAEPSPDMLELYTMVVCTSAMQNENNRRQALERAAAATHGPQSARSRDGDDNDEDEAGEDGNGCRPANGGEVWICKGCMQRERKRANRKKSKKPEDDEEWSRDEHRRIIIFNTNEIKDWQRPTAAALSSLDGDAAGSLVEAVISVPMRITCYCRHHGEKTGFQVILTLKDYQGRLVAQTVSRSIMITDDHKTPTAASAGAISAAASVADGNTSAGDVHDQKAAKVASATKPMSKAEHKPNAPKSLSVSQSTPDLPALKRNSVIFSAPQQHSVDRHVTSPGAAAAAVATDTTASWASKAFSRPASPDGLLGHSSKKRKSSGGLSRVPTELEMTRIETSPQPAALNPALNARGRATASASPVAHFTSNTPFLSPSSGFHPNSMAAAVDMALAVGGSGDPDIDSLAGIVPMNTEPIMTGPLTPNSHIEPNVAYSNDNRSASFDNLAMAQTPMYSAPTSTHPSRAPSPNGLRNSTHLLQQHLFQQQQQQQQQQLLHQQINEAQFSQQFPAGLFSLPMSLSQPTTSPPSHPVIHKIIPSEGPKSGGIEVTILGSAFYQGIDIMFGDQRATTTTYWGESSLVCLVPPSPIAGHVPVTLRQANQRSAPPFVTTQQRITFKYLDDDEQQLLRAALTVLSRKMTGKIEDAQDVARRIIGSETSSWGTSGVGGGGGGNSSGGSSTRGVNGSSANHVGATNPNFETHLLKVLELIDLDDSSNQTRLNMQRRTTGHSMLHLACVLGMHRFVAGLLARGANPDVRDNGGYTPLHLAALNNQPEIVRRLIHAGADPTMRTLSGLTASEVAASREVLRAIRRFERHTRSRSGGSLHSRTSSAASLRSLWEPMAMSSVRHISSARGGGVVVDGDNDPEGSTEDNSSRAEVDSSSYASTGVNEDGSEQDEDEEWLDMRTGARNASRGSMSLHSRRGTRDASPSPLAPNPSMMAVAAAAAAGGAANFPAALASPVAAFKEQLAAHFQQLVAQFPPMPNNPLPDYYQAYLNSAAFQRISSLVPNIGGGMGLRPNSAGDNTNGVSGRPDVKELEGRWWDLSSFMTGSAPPPAYEEIFPHNHADPDMKQAAAAAAAAEAEADRKCTTRFDTPTVLNPSTCEPAKIQKQQLEGQGEQVEESKERGEEEEPTSAAPTLLQIGRKHQITKEQQENFRRAHKEKRKGLGSDTFLYTVWIPILLGVLLLWLSGARAWDFFPSVTFNVPYATSLGNPMRPAVTGNNGGNADNNNNHLRDKQVIAPPPAEAAIPPNDGGRGGNRLHDIVGTLDGLVA
ncbi:membrane-tethered transcription factor [Niveomyces insectorum RCEF 264]|uniref:Membrane-tethered transcription factor n=1 Tax=Niveomyces insectorum RCEF 264 TaxID=1081102 RepID=A0A167ZRX0_9HYPO|nr:membrane-tethered transcription factor [Niveomyces insectorum RCEF 264]